MRKRIGIPASKKYLDCDHNPLIAGQLYYLFNAEGDYSQIQCYIPREHPSNFFPFWCCVTLDGTGRNFSTKETKKLRLADSEYVAKTLEKMAERAKEILPLNQRN